MKALSFNKIKKEIHLKPFKMEVKFKGKDIFKRFKGDKLTFYKDYKSKMIWFNSFGIGIENVVFNEVEEGKEYFIESENCYTTIYLVEGGLK